MRAAPGGLGAVKAGANYVASLLAAEEAKKAGYAQVLWTDAIEHRLPRGGRHHEPLRPHRRRDGHPAARRHHPRGVTRDTLLTLLREWGSAVSERQITIDEVLAAHSSGALREIFGTGTAAVISPVGELGWKGESSRDRRRQPGDLAKRLFKAITDIQYGVVPDTESWTTIVDCSFGPTSRLAGAGHARHLARREARSGPQRLDHPIREAAVVPCPPRSGVRSWPSPITRRIAAFQPLAAVPLADVLEQHRGRQHQRRRVGDALAGDVGRGAVHRLEDRRVLADVGARREAEPADEAGGQVATGCRRTGSS